MGQMGEELKTTDFNVLAGAAEDLKAVQSAAEQYFLLTGNYPTSAGSWSVGTQTILQKFPTDPKSGSYLIDSGAFGGGIGYCFCARLENSNSKSANADWTGSNCDWSNTTNYFCVKNQQ
jgi:hypothetical protein